MKEGWAYKKLGEVCDFEGGSQPPKSEWINHPQNGYVRMLQIRDFTKSRNAEIEYVKITKKLRLCKDDDILIGRYGASVGKILTGLAGAYNVAIIKSIPNEELIRKDFIRRYFESSLFQSILFKVCTSRAAQAGFSKDDIKDELIPVPPLSEQQSIVDYLDSAFAKIDAMKANAEKALNEAKALFQASLKEMLEPKEGWEEKKLKEVVASITDGDHQPPPKSDDGIPFITISNIDKNSNKIVFGETFYVPQSYYCALKKDRIPQQGDVLYTVTGSFGIPVLVDFQKEFCFQRHIALIRPNMGLLSSTYLFYWILSSYATSQAEDTATGAAQRTVSLNSLRNFTINFPPLSVQQSIVETLDSLKSKVDRLQENYDKISQECDALKQAILRQVFE